MAPPIVMVTNMCCRTLSWRGSKRRTRMRADGGEADRIESGYMRLACEA